jgi:Predicted transcriptional regulator
MLFMKDGSSKLLVPCEVAMRDIIPSIKAILVKEIVSQGLSQFKAASLLGLTPAEASYYLRGKRANTPYKHVLESDPEFMEVVRNFAVKLTNNEVVNMCPLCSLARKKLRLQDYSCPYEW